MLYLMTFLCCSGSFKVLPLQKSSSPVLEFFLESEPFYQNYGSLGSGGSLRSHGKPVCGDLNSVLDLVYSSLKFGLAGWVSALPEGNIINGQVRSLCNLHFVSRYPVDYLRFFFCISY